MRRRRRGRLFSQFLQRRAKTEPPNSLDLSQHRQRDALLGQRETPSSTSVSIVSTRPVDSDEYQRFSDSPVKKGSTKMATHYPGNNGGPPPGAFPPPGHQQPPGAAALPDSYFTESRKGEVNELRNLLRNFATERDPQRKRDIIKKVIAYMTLGIDVSRLFTEMMLAIETRDLVIKKMVYLYLCNYAVTHPELAQMCTNTLQKDCGNDDPMVRGLALRALCGLRLPQMVEYISEPLQRSLTDGHAYVRKTGVMGILKMYHLDKEAFERYNFVDTLYDMLRDPDASVVSNCILVLDEVMDGGMALNRAIMLHLLNRIHEFSEFGVVQVLELVPRYIPANEDEGFQIMNLLDPVLRTSNSSAVLATIRAFLSIVTENGDESMVAQVVGRVKAPVITHITSGSPELVYCILQNVEALMNLCPGVFDDEYRQFYVKYHEPTHIKYLKMDLLSKVANPDNAPDIVAELAECVGDVNIQMSRLAVRSMSRIACRDIGGPGCAESICQRLVEMLDLNVPHISSEAATALANIVRKHESLRTVVAPPLPRSLKYITETAGKTSIIFLLGECGDLVKEAPYALEKLIDSYDDIADTSVKIVLLSSTMKLFLLRPPETQRMLGRLLAKATDDVSSQDLHDRALMYFRLLRTSPKIVESVVRTDSSISGLFAEDVDSELRAALMAEFNTLSILYGKTSENFIAKEHQVKFKKMPDGHPLAPGDTSTISVPPPAPAPVVSTPAAAPSGTPPSDIMDLLGFGDSIAPSPASAASATLSLVPGASMTGDVYQAKWSAIPDKDSTVTTVPLRALPLSTDEVERVLAQRNILTMASGELPTEFKFFLYAKDTSGVFFLLQGNMSKSPGEALLILTIKASNGDGASSDAAKVEQLAELMRAALG